MDKISSLARDLSRVLCAERINILAPIPGKDSVGIEIANSNKVAVFLRELLESKDWNNTDARKIPIALGKDVYGKTLVADLAAMPHLLIGGTTGSGKSVCINCILMSFLYRFTPGRNATDPDRSRSRSRCRSTIPFRTSSCRSSPIRRK